MARRKQKAGVKQWVCEQLADFYEVMPEPSDLLAVKEIQHYVVVIGPDGRKFRLQQTPEEKMDEKAMEKNAMNAESILQCARIILGDVSSVKFSDVQLLTALEQVLAEVNSKVPHVVLLQFAATPAGKILTLPVGVAARNVLFVKCLNLDPVQKVDFYFDENSPNVVKLMGKVQNCELNWEVKIVTGHQIDGLDGAETSTIPRLLLKC